MFLIFFACEIKRVLKLNVITYGHVTLYRIYKPNQFLRGFLHNNKYSSLKLCDILQNMEIYVCVLLLFEKINANYSVGKTGSDRFLIIKKNTVNRCPLSYFL